MISVTRIIFSRICITLRFHFMCILNSSIVMLAQMNVCLSPGTRV